MSKTDRFLVAACACLALIAGAAAAEQPRPDESQPQTASKGLSREAQQALICQTVTDWAAFQLAAMIRDDARENHAVSPEGLQILRQMRLTEGLASAAFDTLAPHADHDSMYQNAVLKMQAYLNEDRDGADSSTRQLVPVCQQTYARMAAAGKLSSQQVQLAKDASQEAVTKLTRELQEGGSQD